MDPDENIKLIRTICYRVSEDRHNQDLSDLANLFLDLDAWILNSGHLPTSWTKAQKVLNELALLD